MVRLKLSTEVILSISILFLLSNCSQKSRNETNGFKKNDKNANYVEGYFLQGNELNGVQLSGNNAPFADNPHVFNGTDLSQYNMNKLNIINGGTARYILNGRHTKEITLSYLQFENQMSLNNFTSKKMTTSTRPNKPYAVDNNTLIQFEIGQDDWWSPLETWSSDQKKVMVNILGNYENRIGAQIKYYDNENEQNRFINWMKQIKD